MRSKAYIVHDNCGDRVTAVRVVDMTNPAEWDLAVECQREQPWLSVEEFQLEANEGECFIVLKDRVVMAYHNSIGDFLTYEDGSFCYVKADITKVKHINVLMQTADPHAYSERWFLNFTDDIINRLL